MKNKDITTHIIVELLANIQESPGINPQCYIEKVMKFMTNIQHPK